MALTRRSENVHSSLRLTPELPDAKKRAIVWICVILAGWAAVPAAVLVCGYTRQWQPALRPWIAQAVLWLVLVGFYAAWGVYRTVRNLRKDETVRIEFTPDFLTLVRRYSCVEIEYPSLAGMRLVYRPVDAANGIGQYVTHRRMRLILYGTQEFECIPLDHHFGDELDGIDGDFGLLSWAAAKIRDRVETIGGQQIEYDEFSDREYRLFQKQVRMAPPSFGIILASMTLLLTAGMVWLAFDLSAQPDSEGFPWQIPGIAGMFLVFVGGLSACCYFGAMPAVVHGRPVLVRKEELAEDYW